MRQPTPDTTMAMTRDSGSARSVTATVNGPTWIQSHRGCTNTRSLDAWPSRPIRTIVLTTNDAPTVIDATRPLSRNRRPNAKISIDPANGRAGISQSSAIDPVALTRSSPSQQVGVVDVGAAASAEQRDDDGEAHHDLGGRHHHREERQDLAVQVPDLPAERDQRQVHRVQLELHRHEDHERVAAQQHAGRADREQHAREHQEVGDRRSHATVSGTPAGARSVSPGPIPGGPGGEVSMACRVITIAATAATISSTDVTSNGKKNELKGTFAKAWTLPPLFATWSKFGAAFVATPTPRRTASTISATSPAASTSAAGRSPLRCSTRDSCRSTPSSMITNRNSTMIAPASTMVCTS